MRGIAGRLCHGRERGTLEPYGVAAPLLRLMAWVLMLVASLGGLGMTIAAALAAEQAVVVSGSVAFVAAMAALTVRYIAGSARPYPLTLTVRERS